MTELQLDSVESPIGKIELVTREDGALCALDFEDRGDILRSRLATRFGEVALRPASDPCGHTSRLRAYLGGDLNAFDDAHVEPGGTPFQQQVWRQLRRVPAGTTQSYKQLAAAINKPSAARAVGTANGRNPIALAIPCHRIIAANQTLGGYAGGLARKTWLLNHEAKS
jgi:methylated-DNA-[protein]-cysteine S-methyltransferase